jgi:hypothetical protein
MMKNTKKDLNTDITLLRLPDKNIIKIRGLLMSN